MDKMFKLGGKQLGEKYYFKYRGQKFEIKLGYTGGVYYGMFDLVTVFQMDGNRNKNTFNLGELCGCKYDIDDKTCRKIGYPSVIVKDFDALNEQIVDWLNFIVED